MILFKLNGTLNYHIMHELKNDFAFTFCTIFQNMKYFAYIILAFFIISYRMLHTTL
jgi:hypothetical protein